MCSSDLLTGGIQQEELSILTVLPNLDIAFKVEPIGLLFALVASGLWMLTHLFCRYDRRIKVF